MFANDLLQLLAPLLFWGLLLLGFAWLVNRPRKGKKKPKVTHPVEGYRDSEIPY